MKNILFFFIFLISCSIQIDDQSIVKDEPNEYDLTELNKCEIFTGSDKSNKNIAFIGDSRTRDLFKYVPYDFNENGLNFGVGGISSYGIIARFDLFDKYNFDTVILAIGHNDNYDYFERNMKEIFNYFSKKKIQLYVSTVVWRNDMKGDVTGINDRIDRLNLVINKLSNDFMYTVIDINSLLSNNHMLRYDYCIGDSIHFNADGYRKIIGNYHNFIE